MTGCMSGLLMCSGVDDLFEMIQSKTFIHQLGYGIIKIFIVNNFPELRPLFRQMEMSVSHNATMSGTAALSLRFLAAHCWKSW